MKCSEENAKFLIEHPDHTPLLDDNGDVIGISSPCYSLPVCPCCKGVIWAGEWIAFTPIGKCHADCYESSVMRYPATDEDCC